MEATEALGMAELAERIVASAEIRGDASREPVSTVTFSYFGGKVDSFCARLSIYHWLQLNFEPDEELMQRWADFPNGKAALAQVSTAKPAELVRMVDHADWNLDCDALVWQVFTDNPEHPSHLAIRFLSEHGYTPLFPLKIISEPGVWLASAKVSHLQAGDHRWQVEAGDHRWQVEAGDHRWQVEAGDHRWQVENGYGFSFQAEGVDCSEFFLTPFVDEDNLGDEQDAYELRIEKQLTALGETTLNPRQVEKARAELEEARQEARNLRILELIGDASLVLVRRDQKLVAVVDGFDHEITAGNDWL